MTEEGARHLEPAERRAVQEFIAELRRRYGAQVLDVRLFGSKARGDAGPESDVDLLVVVAGDEREMRDQIGRIASRIELEYGIVLSDITMSAERFEWHRAHRAPFYNSVTRGGIRLWTGR